MNRLAKSIVYSNILIGLIAVSLIQFTSNIFQLKGLLFYQILILVASPAVYNLMMISGLPKNSSSITDIKQKWYYKHKKSIELISYSALAISGLLSLTLNLKSILILGCSTALSLLYYIPFIKNKPLRTFSQTKMPLIALVWTLVCFVIPLMVGIPFAVFTLQQKFLLGFGFLFLVLGVAIPFDIKDQTYDIQFNSENLAVKFGIKKVKQLAIVSLVFSSFLMILFYLTSSANIFANPVAFFLPQAFTIVTIFGIKENYNDLYYTLVVDGSLILPWLFTVIF